MSTYQIPAPSPMVLHGDVAENWKDESAWKYYALATQLNDKLTKANGDPNPSGILQVAAILCAVMGTDCLKIMKSLPTLSETDKGDANRILEELRGHFVPQRRVLFERYKFNSSTQKGETVDEFVVKLRQLAESCEFGTLKDSLIRDRLVIGTTDDVCRDRLLRERPVPDLNHCIECLRASELSRSHKQHMSTLGKESIDYMHGRPVHKNKSYQQKGKQPATQSNTQKPTPTTGDDCHWCGAKPAHPRKTCPARDAKCSRCKKNGHYGHKCQSSKSKSNEVQDEDYVNVAFLGEVQSSTNAFWTADLHVNKHPTSFKLDSGAGVTIISEKTPWHKQFPPQPNTCQFRGAGNVDLTDRVTGQIPKATLGIAGEAVTEDIFVMRGQNHNLLSKWACQQLKLLKPSEVVYNIRPILFQPVTVWYQLRTGNLSADNDRYSTGPRRYRLSHGRHTSSRC